MRVFFRRILPKGMLIGEASGGQGAATHPQLNSNITTFGFSDAFGGSDGASD
ncbi:hypothetical protein SBA4_780014 [Candidatus Sulfopaludibacter sp. SbA4]|nr:hypothetical protein SBA4_780014 [Candidatus Sulfopaludibacter sp. SbA4]